VIVKEDLGENITSSRVDVVKIMNSTETRKRYGLKKDIEYRLGGKA